MIMRSFFVLTFLLVQSVQAEDIVWKDNQAIAEVSSAWGNSVAFNNTYFISGWENYRYIVWSDSNQLFFISSIDNGETWEKEKRSLGKYQGIIRPGIAVTANGTIGIIWQEGTRSKSNIRIISSSDNGKSWGEPVTLSGNYDALRRAAGIEAGDDKLYASWSSMTQDSVSHVMFTKYENDKWSEPLQLDDTTDEASWPSITVRGNTVYAVWRENSTGIWSIYFNRSSDNGETWEKQRKISDGQGWDPTIGVTSNGKYVVVTFFQKRNILITFSDNFGQTFSEDATIVQGGRFPRIVNNDDGFFGIVFEKDVSFSQNPRSETKQTGFVYSIDYGKTFFPHIFLTDRINDAFGNVSLIRPHELISGWVTQDDEQNILYIKRGFIKD